MLLTPMHARTPPTQARDADMAFKLWEASEAAIAGALQRAGKQCAA